MADKKASVSFLASIRGKIATAFGALMVVSVATGAFSISKLNEVSHIGARLSQEIAAVSTLGDLGRTSQTLSVISFLQHDSQTEEARGQYAAEAADARNEFSKSWSDYSTMISGDDEAKLASSLRKAWQHFLAVQEEVVDLDNAGLHDQANDVLMNDLSHERVAFYEAVRHGYLALARDNPARVRLLSGAEPIETVASKIWEQLTPLLPAR